MKDRLRFIFVSYLSILDRNGIGTAFVPAYQNDRDQNSCIVLVEVKFFLLPQYIQNKNMHTQNVVKACRCLVMSDGAMHT